MIQNVDDDASIASAQTMRDAHVIAARVWAVPDSVPLCLTVLLAVTELSIEPERGELKRFSMDPVVCGVWLAMYWGKLDAAVVGGAVAVDTAAGLAVGSPLYKLERHIVDWPFDLYVFAPLVGSTRS